MKCKVCGENHENTNNKGYCVVHNLYDSGFPTHSRSYQRAHTKANIAEKATFGDSGFNAMKKVDAGLKKHELAGKNTKTGKIEVSAKVPKKYRAEVALHEEVESKALRKKK
jgi:hypothetical protein